MNLFPPTQTADHQTPTITMDTTTSGNARNAMERYVKKRLTEGDLPVAREKLEAQIKGSTSRAKSGPALNTLETLCALYENIIRSYLKYHEELRIALDRCGEADRETVEGLEQSFAKFLV